MSIPSYDEFHRKCREVFPATFDGIKAILNKGLSQHFQVSHSVNLASNQNGYRFGATYAGTQKTEVPDEAFPVMLGDIDLQGNTSATIMHQFLNGIRLKGIAYVQQSKLVTAQGVMEYRTRLSNSCLTIADPNILLSTGGIVATHVQQITKNLQLGGELVTFLGSQKPGQTEVMSVLSGGFRYFTSHWSAALTGSQNSLSISYHHKPTDTLQFSVNLESNFRQQEAKATFAYQAEISDSFAFRASCDTDWTVASVMEKKLSKHLPINFALSMIHNFSKPVTKVGVGLILAV